ncbi:hypothetical protein M422DRAFT_203025 [Sphaerobolus stellatus SS14]|nr:hypothetical protein M422DRAFT_203025 [Sphaerobolus stellatus SS14]
MKFVKPSWVLHHDSGDKEHKKRLAIFSVHVHPDGSRIATGGLDAKVRIWSTKPILNEAAHEAGIPPPHLSTLTMHTGPVLTVRWANSGRWLASGSDDAVVMVWDLDPNGGGKVWGSDEVNVEAWKALKRLPGHESDVTDLAWAPNDRFLASVGLDSMVIIWCGSTLQQLIRLEGHQGFVKGVCWDPVGQYLATQSDDKTVKIWRTTDWGLEASIDKPFRESPGSTFFRRLSWSPDGAHITASNAMNNKGAVFVAAVIARSTWTSEISLVGHENTVEVAAYNPHIFLRNPDAAVATSNICSVVALGADDRSISIWQTKSARPLIVARNVFERQILDLSWSFDGLTLYACSSDGSVAVFNFTADELEGIAPTSVQQQYLKKFDFVPPPVPKLYTPPVAYALPQPQQQVGFSAPTTVNGSGEVVNQLVARRGGKNKKRIQPTLVSGLPNAAAPSQPYASQSMAGPSHQGPGHPGSMVLSHGYGFDQGGGYDSSGNAIRLPPPPMQSAYGANAGSYGAPSHPHGSQWTSNSHGAPYVDSTSPFYVPPPSQQDDAMMGGGAPSIDAYGPDGQKGKRKASDMDVDGPRTKARTLGGDRVRDASGIQVKEINAGADIADNWAVAGPARVAPANILSVPRVLSYLTVRVEDTRDDILEGNNYEDGRPSEVSFVNGKQVQWLDYLHSPVIALAASTVFCAVALVDGSLNVYSHTGRKMMLTVHLTAPISFLESLKSYLMAITASGDLTVWNVKAQKAVFPPTSLLPLLNQTSAQITSVGLRPNGAPIVSLSSGVAYSYDPSLLSWVRVSELWWADGSDAWSGRQRSTATNASRGILAILESGLSELPQAGAAETGNAEKPQWWNAAKTLGHLEQRMGAAKLLDSQGEFKHSLLLYAKKLAEEGFRGKAEELIKELFGPVYWRPNKDEKWDPTILGLSKRDLLKEVLSIFARSKTLAKLGMDWQDILRRSVAED